MSNFLERVGQEQNRWGRTDNGADARNLTGSAVLDLYGVIGAARDYSDDQIVSLVDRAYQEDSLLTLKTVFYARDVRGGLGERRVPRVILRRLAEQQTEAVRTNLSLLPFYGRWDDLFVLFDTPVELDVLDLIKFQFDKDWNAVHEGEYLTMSGHKPSQVSLLAKWLPTMSSRRLESKLYARKIMKHLGMNQERYRKAVSKMRAHLKVVEVKMSARQWDNIDYSAVPSRAMMIYRQAFQRHEPELFGAYMESLSKGETKINSATLFPYDIFEKAGLTEGEYYVQGSSFHFKKMDDVLAAQWEALPNYVQEGKNVLVMADTSASMRGLPMSTALSLAVYFAERNKGHYKDYMMTFSTTPSLVKLTGNTLAAKIRNIPSIVSSTNIEAAFDLLLRTAVANKVDQSELPVSLVIITDMQFDQGSTVTSNWNRSDLSTRMAAKFAQAGYIMPNIVYWNVSSPRPSFQATSEYRGVQMVSGSSAAIFKSVMDNIGKDPYEAMVYTLNSERYSAVVL